MRPLHGIALSAIALSVFCVGVAHGGSGVFKHATLKQICNHPDLSLRPSGSNETFSLVVKMDGPAPSILEIREAGSHQIYSIYTVDATGQEHEVRSTYSITTAVFEPIKVHEGDVLLVRDNLQKGLQLQIVADRTKEEISFQPCDDASFQTLQNLQWIEWEFCLRWQVCQRHHKVEFDAWIKGIRGDWNSIDENERVSRITTFVKDFLPKRNKTHLIPADPLPADATLEQQIIYNYIMSMSVLANTPLPSQCTVKENPARVATNAVRIVAEGILTPGECSWLEAHFNKRIQAIKASGGPRPGEDSINMLAIGADYAWENHASYTAHERFGADHVLYPDRNADKRFHKIQRRLQKLANQVAREAGLKEDLVVDTILVQKTPENGHFPHSDSCRWVQPNTRFLQYDDTDKQNIQCEKHCAEEDGMWVAGHTPQRVVSMSIPLNVGYEGGHLYIFGEPEEEYKLAAGSAAAFTSTQVHQVEKVTSGERLVLLAWWKHEHTFEPPRVWEGTWADGIFTKAEVHKANKRAGLSKAKVINFKYDHEAEAKEKDEQFEKMMKGMEGPIEHVNPVIVPPHMHAIECSSTKGPLRIALNEEWSPQGVRRFLDLVKAGFFTDHPLYRAVPNFLTQFGVAGTPSLHKEWLDKGPFHDDPDVGVPFRYGTLSFAGSGPNTRDTSLFLVTASDPRQLRAFGQNPWERPLGIMTQGAAPGETLGEWYTGYGDMAELPGGKGPSHRRVMEEGSTYTKKEFPQLDYLHRCEIVPASPADVRDLIVAWGEEPGIGAEGPPKQASGMAAIFENEGTDDLEIFFQPPDDPNHDGIPVGLLPAGEQIGQGTHPGHVFFFRKSASDDRTKLHRTLITQGKEIYHVAANKGMVKDEL